MILETNSRCWCNNFSWVFACQFKMKTRARDRADMLYDFALWLFNIMLDIFFREIRPRGSHKIPTEGPTIFVAAPHANQVKTESKSRKQKKGLVVLTII